MNLPVVPTRLLLEEEFAEPFGAEIAGDAESAQCDLAMPFAIRACLVPVSYTHLTLPTICSV